MAAYAHYVSKKISKKKKIETGMGSFNASNIQTLQHPTLAGIMVCTRTEVIRGVPIWNASALVEVVTIGCRICHSECGEQITNGNNKMKWITKSRVAKVSAAVVAATVIGVTGGAIHAKRDYNRVNQTLQCWEDDTLTGQWVGVRAVYIAASGTLEVNFYDRARMYYRPSEREACGVEDHVYVEFMP